MNKIEKIRTGISKAHWCVKKNSEFEFEQADMPNITTQEGQIAWFDELFEGGIV